MRTTFALDDDIADRLKELAAEKQMPFRQAVNDTLRLGLKLAASREQELPFEVKSFRSQFSAGVDPDKLNQLLDELEANEAGTKVSR